MLQHNTKAPRGCCFCVGQVCCLGHRPAPATKAVGWLPGCFQLDWSCGRACCCTLPSAVHPGWLLRVPPAQNSVLLCLPRGVEPHLACCHFGECPWQVCAQAVADHLALGAVSIKHTKQGHVLSRQPLLDAPGILQDSSTRGRSRNQAKTHPHQTDSKA